VLAAAGTHAEAPIDVEELKRRLALQRGARGLCGPVVSKKYRAGLAEAQHAQLLHEIRRLEPLACRVPQHLSSGACSGRRRGRGIERGREEGCRIRGQIGLELQQVGQ
jgi:hypothetical protein